LRQASPCNRWHSIDSTNCGKHCAFHITLGHTDQGFFYASDSSGQRLKYRDNYINGWTAGLEATHLSYGKYDGVALIVIIATAVVVPILRVIIRSL
jgi:hypothetical protein